MYETVVIGLFIGENDQDTAQRYLDHVVIDNYKRSNEMIKHKEVLNIETLSNEEFELLKKERNEVIQKYGKSFKTPYGWAADTLRIKKPSFRHIEQKVGLEHLRPYYQLACLAVHAGPMSILFDLGMPEIDRLLLAGPSNRGLADAGQGTAISLNQINIGLLSTKINFENLLGIQVSNLWVKDLLDEFIKVHNIVEEKTSENLRRNDE